MRLPGVSRLARRAAARAAIGVIERQLATTPIRAEYTNLIIFIINLPDKQNFINY
jgi:hypothetical protein